MHPTCTEHALHTHSTCTQHAFNMHSSCTQHALNMHSVQNWWEMVSHGLTRFIVSSFSQLIETWPCHVIQQTQPTITVDIYNESIQWRRQYTCPIQWRHQYKYLIQWRHGYKSFIQWRHQYTCPIQWRHRCTCIYNFNITFFYLELYIDSSTYNSYLILAWFTCDCI